jgi:hypothetical protein
VLSVGGVTGPGDTSFCANPGNEEQQKSAIKTWGKARKFTSRSMIPI